MVDIKRVTATIKNPNIYGSAVTTNVTNESINIDPSAVPPNLYIIDPFAVFMQDNSRLEVKIPFSRFYRIKAVLSYSQFITSATSADAFSISKPLIGSTDTLTINKISNNVTSTINSNVFTQDGSGYVIFDPNNANASSFTKRYLLTPAIVEGIVELYAGDVLYFTHTRNFFDQLSVLGFDGVTGLIEPSFPLGETYLLPGTRNTALGVYIDTTYSSWFRIDLPYGPDGNLLTNPYSANSSFFFEISELTDL
jgi:hypothetical protein